MVAGDFNGDGRLDLAVTNSGVSVLLGNGDGTFQTPQNYTVGMTPISIVAGDFNRDGELDLAVANSVGVTVSINIGNAPLLLTGLNVSANFDLVAGSGTPADCTASSTLAPGELCNVSVSFTPSAITPMAGTLTLTDNALHGVPATQQISLSGTGQGPVAAASATSLQFGTIPFSSTSTLSVTVSNTGGGTLTLAPSINGQSFNIAGSNCGAGVAAGGSCVLQVQFSAAKAGQHHDILTLVTNGPSNPTVTLNGTAQGVSLGSETMQFGTIPLGATKVLPLTLTNMAPTGVAIIGASTSGPSYKILTTAQNTCMAGLPPHQSCTLPVEFDPISAGPHNDYLNLTISSDGPSTAFVVLEGIASSP